MNLKTFTRNVARLPSSTKIFSMLSYINTTLTSLKLVELKMNVDIMNFNKNQKKINTQGVIKPNFCEKRYKLNNNLIKR